VTLRPPLYQGLSYHRQQGGVVTGLRGREDESMTSQFRYPTSTSSSVSLLRVFRLILGSLYDTSITALVM